MRRILCEECGKLKPTPLEDAVLGFIPRRTCGKALNSLVCDACGKAIDSGKMAVAESIPSSMGL